MRAGYEIHHLHTPRLDHSAWWGLMPDCGRTPAGRTVGASYTWLCLSSTVWPAAGLTGPSRGRVAVDCGRYSCPAAAARPPFDHPTRWACCQRLRPRARGERGCCRLRPAPRVCVPRCMVGGQSEYGSQRPRTAIIACPTGELYPVTAVAFSAAVHPVATSDPPPRAQRLAASACTGRYTCRALRLCA